MTNTLKPEFRSAEDYAFHRLVRERGISALRKYQLLIVGELGLWKLLRYELVFSTVAFVPGALGIVLRRWIYRRLLRRVGRGVVIGRSVTLRHPHKISIGNGCVIDDYAVVNALGPDASEIVLGDRVLIGRDCIVKTRGGKIIIHDDANIGPGCRIGTSETAEIGRNALIGSCCFIGSGDHQIEEPGAPIALQGYSPKGGVAVGAGSWLGVNVVVLDGVQIGEGSVVGAGAVVTRDIPSDAVAHGVPARVVRMRT